MSGKGSVHYNRILAAVLVTTILIPGILAAGIDNDSRFHPLVVNPVITPVNSSTINDTALAQYHRNPEPVGIFKAEVREPSLPGPRYMAFGPSIIGVSIDPVILSTLIVLGVLGIAAGCIGKYGGGET
jgi:hypothetical protein